MKKSLVALAALAAVSAYAQSSVTMYGVVEPTIDIAYKNTLNTRTDTFNAAGVMTSRSSTSSTYKPGFRVNDGNDQGVGSSRIGWLGTEDLGGGLKAKFQLEMGLRIDDGCVTTGAGNVCSSGNSGGNLFGRNTWAGIEGSLGEVRIGRQVAGSFGVQGKSWAPGASNGLYDAGASVTTPMAGVRFSNGIKYISPNMSGFQGTLMLAAPENAPGTNTNTSATTAGGVVSTTDAKAKTGIDLALEYANGPLYVGYGYAKTNAMTAANNGLAAPLNSFTFSNTPSRGHTLGAAYDFGVVKPFVNFTRTRGSVNPTTVTNGITSNVLSEARTKAWTIGLRAPIGAATLIASYGTEKTTASGSSLTAGAQTARADSYGKEKAAQIGMQYPLSKRTLLEANVGRYKNDATVRATGLAAGVPTGSTLVATNQKISAVNFGIRHSF